MTLKLTLLALIFAVPATGVRTARPDDVPAFADLLARPVTLKRELVGVHPRVFITSDELTAVRARARTDAAWKRVLVELPALKSDPPPPPGPQERRSQNNVAFAIAGASLAYAVERDPMYLAAAKKWTLAAIDYEPWGYIYNKPNVDLAAGHLLYAIGWAYDLLYHDLAPAERDRIRASLERHAQLVADFFVFSPGKGLNFTQNHDFIPTSGLAVTALALLGEIPAADSWARLARAHHHRANQLLSPDGYYYEGMEYWIFSAPWLVHFYDAWEHATGESLWELGPARNWKYYLAHALLPDGQNVFDFGDIWEGPLTRARAGAEYDRVFPGGTLQSNYNVMYRVAAHFRDQQAQAVAERYGRFQHSNLEEYWTLLWRDAALAAAPMRDLPLTHHFEDMGLVYSRTSWTEDATAFAFKAGPPEGHRAVRLRPLAPEWHMDSGHAHPDNGSFIIWANGRYLTGDTGYAGQPAARHHNTIAVDGVGQGLEGDHDVWRRMSHDVLDGIKIRSVKTPRGSIVIEADLGAAYPAKAGVRELQRTFTYNAPGTFEVTDTIITDAPRRVQWYLHSDTPISKTNGLLLLGNGLKVTITSPADAQVTTAATMLTAPGRPGSITEGPTDQRGYHVLVETSPAARAAIAATLVVKPPTQTQKINAKRQSAQSMDGRRAHAEAFSSAGSASLR